MNFRRVALTTTAALATGAAIWFAIDLGSNSAGPESRSLNPGAATNGSTGAGISDRPDDAAQSLVKPRLAARDGSLADALAQPGKFDRHHALERLGFDAAQEGTDVALRMLSGISGKADRSAFLRGMFAKAAEAGATSAMRLLKALPDAADRKGALAGLVESWEPELDFDDEKDVLAQQSSFLTPEGRMLARLSKKPALAVECARELLSGSDLTAILSYAARIEAARDPQLALSFGAGLTGNERAGFLKAYAQGWARSQGASAFAWASQESNSVLRDQLQNATLLAWSVAQPEAALAHVGDIANEKVRQQTLEGITSRWATADTKAALDWVQSLPDATQRDALTTSIQNVAPVGIGVSLASGPDGMPVINEVLPGGSASTTGVLKSGHRIAAVGDGRGNFTDLQGVPLNEVTRMIRGLPGTSVVLQVVPAAGNTAQRQTISIPRKQLLWKAPEPGTLR